MNATATPVKVELITGSLRCFTLGLLGLLPVVGFPLAIMALGEYRRMKRLRAEWNPARRYLSRGAAFGWLGVALLLLEAGIAITVTIAIAIARA
jgi:hypothetical protein